MKKRKVSLPVVLGVCLILASICIMLGYQFRMRMGVQKSRMIVSQVNALLPERIPGIPELYPESCMPVLEIEGDDYVGILEIPAFGIILPVADKWDSKSLSDSPTRFFGSAYDNTLVIGGSDYPEQFGFCDKIGNGAYVIVTDMTGSEFTYTVSNVERAKHAETQWLLDADCDLTLFCRDMYSMEYIAVRCVFAYK